MVSREAAFLISLATEEFIKRIVAETRKVAVRDKRSILQQKDLGIVGSFPLRSTNKSCHLATVVRRVDEFVFLDGQYLNPQKVDSNYCDT
jgi:hypothetical protein